MATVRHLIPNFTPGWHLRLAEARESVGLSQEEAALAIGLTQVTTWSRWEANAFDRPPDLTSLFAVEYVLGIRREWVLAGIKPMLLPTPPLAPSGGS